MSLIWIAAAVSPTMIGTIGVSPGSGLNPASVICSRKYVVFSRSFSHALRMRLDDSRTAASALAATVGGSAFEKSCGRDALRQIVGQRRRPGDESARRAAERLAERRRDDVDLAEHAEMLGGAAAGLAEHAGRVRVVHDDDRVVSRAICRISGSFAIAPSIEKTPSVQMIRRLRALRARASLARRSSMSACL